MYCLDIMPYMFNSRELYEEIPSNDKHFIKLIGVLKFEIKPTTNNTLKVKKTAPQSDDDEYTYTYKVRYYDSNTKPFGYVTKFLAFRAFSLNGLVCFLCTYIKLELKC